MRNISKTIFLVGILAVVLLTACSERRQEAEPVIRPVRYQTVVAVRNEALTRTFSGVVKAGLESTLSFKVSGTINDILVKVGDEVQEGQVIATVNATDYVLQEQLVEAQLQQAKAQAKHAKTQYDRVQQMFEKNGTSQSSLDEARTGYESAMATVHAIEKQLALQQSQTSYTTLKAPFHGVISAVDAEVNENIQAGDSIAVLTGQLSEQEVEVAIPDSYIAQIQKGQTVSVTFNATLDNTVAGVVTEVAVASSSTSATYPVAVTLTETDPRARPGMVAEVTFTFAPPEHEGRILLPSHAVLEDRNGRFVYVAEPAEDDLAITKRMNVTVGNLTGDKLEITGGLTEGQYVITAGVSRIREDMQVKLSEEFEQKEWKE